MKEIFSRLYTIIALLAFVISCEKSANYRTFTYPMPSVSGMSPGTGYPGTNVTISGQNLDTLTGAVKVWFGGIQASNVVSSTNTQIVVQVPANAASGKVSLQVWTNKLDSVGSFTVFPAPVITANFTKHAQSNVAFPGDTVYVRGSRFGSDASKALINFSQTAATNVPLYSDTLIEVIAPANFSTGFISLTIGGLTIKGSPAIINPNAPGNVTPYFLGNTGDTAKGGGFKTATSPLVSNRWGTLAAPWITNAAAQNKSGVGGYSGDIAPGGIPGSICWETWNNTPITDGIMYQPTSMPLSAGTYTLSVKYYTEVQQNSTVDFVAAAGNSGIPVSASLSTALGYVALASPANVGSTSPNLTETKSFNFTLTASQVVSVGFLGNLKWGNGTGNPGCYIRIDWIKLVKN